MFGQRMKMFNRHSTSLLVLSFLCCALWCNWGQSQEVQSQDSTKQASGQLNYWIFLTTGKSVADVERKEVERMQAEHLANFKRLFDLGKLRAAGPMKDPEKKMRGIVYASAENESVLKTYFESDPYIQQGFLVVQAYPVAEQLGQVSSKFSDSKMEEFQLVIVQNVEGGNEVWSTEVAKATRESLQSMHTPDKLRLALKFDASQKDIVGILVLKQQDEAEVKRLLSSLPLVANGKWKTTTLPLYMSQGILD